MRKNRTVGYRKMVLLKFSKRNTTTIYDNSDVAHAEPESIDGLPKPTGSLVGFAGLSVRHSSPSRQLAKFLQPGNTFETNHAKVLLICLKDGTYKR